MAARNPPAAEEGHIDPKVARARLARLARGGRGLRDPVSKELARRLREALAPVRIDRAGAALELGCGLAPPAPLLAMEAAPLRVDLIDWPQASPDVVADALALPFAAASFDLVWANNLLPWIHAPRRALEEARRVLKEGGLFAATSLGPDTLVELSELLPAGPPRAQGFLDMHDLADMAVHAGFAEPVAASERLTLSYSTPRAMLAELSRFGVLAARGMELSLGKTAKLRRLLGSARQVELTFEVIYLHAWALPQRRPKGPSDWQEMSFAPLR